MMELLNGFRMLMSCNDTEISKLTQLNIRWCDGHFFSFIADRVTPTSAVALYFRPMDALLALTVGRSAEQMVHDCPYY